ncbi:hypothetical protein BDD43_2483 [Mucilaginibacter gracilis]|uniref:Uncharacterized protein n=1 Tax=Mucilaginibacter gracilis TaxID=423350 RepID=A0A495J047_9SPHI|nr:hypothetical protein [Mucilaginibacter gracilis]RKR82307.1 hypothetical protein BDD43_2483 [Mucilaginibacter gracilis]
MNEIKKITYNCRKATFLIEKKQIGAISLREQLELRLHLAGCSVCKTFERQSILINRMVKQLINDNQHPEIKLSDTVKKEMQNRIENELNKN